MTDETPTPPSVTPTRRVRARRWTLLGTVAAAGLAAAAPARAAAPDAGGGEQVANAPAAQLQLAASSQQDEGGEGGEGGEGAALPGAASVDYLAELGYVEGHLRAARALYQTGEAAMAKSHLKHPGDELYAGLEPKLEAHGAEPFGDDLVAVIQAADDGSPDAVDAALGKVLHEIAAARARAGDGAGVRLRAVATITRAAAHEYENAVKDGRIAELHEYQDAWGFIEAARAMTEGLDGSADSTVREAVAKVRRQFAVIATAFGAGLTPGASAAAEDPSVLYGAAARMELAGFGVK